MFTSEISFMFCKCLLKCIFFFLNESVFVIMYTETDTIIEWFYFVHRIYTHIEFTWPFNMWARKSYDSEIQFLHTIFSNLRYPKHPIDKVFSATKKKFYNLPSPLDTEELSAILVLSYNASFKQFQRIIKSSLNT